MADLVKYESFSEDEVSIIQSYKDNGKPGFQKIKDDQITRWFELFMSGKTYKEIAKLESAPLEQILYISSEFGWYDRKMVHIGDLILGMTQKLTAIKLETTNTLNTTISAMNRYFGDTFDRYLQSGDATIMESVDTKLLVQYYKAVDTLSKLTTPAQTPDNNTPNPNLNINLNGNTTIKADGQDIEITEENAGKILKTLANAKKARES